MLKNIFSFIYWKRAHKFLWCVILLFTVIISFFIFGSFSPVSAQSWWDYNTDNCKEPWLWFWLCIVSNIVGKENKDTGIIQTDLDMVNRDFGGFDSEYRISNTLSNTKEQLESYIEWITFIGFSVAVVLLIYNGLLLVVSPLSEDQSSAVKKRIWYILMGVVVMAGFYFILKVLISILVDVTKR